MRAAVLTLLSFFLATSALAQAPASAAQVLTRSYECPQGQTCSFSCSSDDKNLLSSGNAASASISVAQGMVIVNLVEVSKQSYDLIAGGSKVVCLMQRMQMK
jgi:hypothetical protein